MASYTKVQLFPTLVYDIDCSELIDDTIKVFEKIKWTNSSVSSSYFELSKNKKLTKKFEDNVNEALSEIEYTVPLRMTTSWFTMIPPGNSGEPHYHVNSFWSGVFYPFDNSSNFVIDKKLPQIHVPYKTQDMSLVAYGSVGFPARRGHMLLFPSYMMHRIELNKSDENRHSLAMNFMPSGFCDNDDSSYYYNESSKLAKKFG